jgi:hypothetical protein
MPSRTFRVAATTTGRVSPGYEHMAGGYKYRGDPDWKPGDMRYREPRPAEPLPQNAKVSAGRAQRLAEYARLRLADVSKEQAAAQLGISRSTGRMYEREFRQQRGERDD